MWGRLARAEQSSLQHLLQVQQKRDKSIPHGPKPPASQASPAGANIAPASLRSRVPDPQNFPPLLAVRHCPPLVHSGTHPAPAPLPPPAHRVRKAEPSVHHQPAARLAGWQPGVPRSVGTQAERRGRGEVDRGEAQLGECHAHRRLAQSRQVEVRLGEDEAAGGGGGAAQQRLEGTAGRGREWGRDVGGRRAGGVGRELGAKRLGRVGQLAGWRSAGPRSSVTPHLGRNPWLSTFQGLALALRCPCWAPRIAVQTAQPQAPRAASHSSHSTSPRPWGVNVS